MNVIDTFYATKKVYGTAYANYYWARKAWQEVPTSENADVLAAAEKATVEAQDAYIIARGNLPEDLVSLFTNEIFSI